MIGGAWLYYSVQATYHYGWESYVLVRRPLGCVIHSLIPDRHGRGKALGISFETQANFS